MSKSDNLSEKEFWNEFWSKIKLPEIVNYKSKNDRVISETIKKHIPIAEKGQTSLEVGCAPGKWLVFFHKELKYCITGVEYLEVASQKTIENFILNNIPASDFDVIQTDFFAYESDRKYDVVFSLGFIEHFEDYEMVMKKHLDLVKKDGYLVFGIPNFRGITWAIEMLVDLFLPKKNRLLPKHNLKIMNLEVFKKFGKDNGLKTIFLDYIGGFDGGFFPTNHLPFKFLSIFFIICIKIASILFGNINLPYTSGYIFSIYKKI